MENLIGFILPPVIAFANQKVTNSYVRFGISLLIPAIAAIGLHYSELSFMNPDQVFGSISLLALEAQIAYRTYWHEDSPVRQMISK
jgi:hypothetical protein